MNDFRRILEQRYDLSDVEYVSNAVQYEDHTPLHKFVSVIAPLRSSGPLVLLTARDSFSEQLCLSIVAFLRHNSPALSLDRKIVVLDGFVCCGDPFDSILVLNGSYHKMYEHISGSLNAQTLAAFPIARCEITGRETEAELDEVRRDGPCMIDWNRTPSPFVRMRFCNTRTGASSQGKRLWYTRSSYVEHEVRSLTESKGSFVELQNFLCEMVRIVVRDGMYAIDGDGTMCVRHGDISAWLAAFLACGLEAQ